MSSDAGGRDDTHAINDESLQMDHVVAGGPRARFWQEEQNRKGRDTGVYFCFC